MNLSGGKLPYYPVYYDTSFSTPFAICKRVMLMAIRTARLNEILLKVTALLEFMDYIRDYTE